MSRYNLWRSDTVFFHIFGCVVYEMSKKDLRNWTRRVRCLFIQATISFLRNAWRTSASCSHCALKAWASVPSARLHVVVRLLYVCFFGVNEITTVKQANQNQNKQLTRLLCWFYFVCLSVFGLERAQIRTEPISPTIDVDSHKLFRFSY